MSRRPDGRVSLLGGERESSEDFDRAAPRGRRPNERNLPEGGSVHSSFHELSPPKEDFDVERARSICADITRQLLRDFAPAMALLGAQQCKRVQGLVAYTRTLLDFAGDTTLEGERLAQINRWQFALEQALSGEPPGQPVFVVLADAESDRAWPREALDELAAVARSRISDGRPTSADELEKTDRRLAAAIYEALSDRPCPSDVRQFGEAILRLHSLLGWRDRLFHDRPDLGLDGDHAQGFGATVAAESQSIRRLLAPIPDLAGLDPRLARAARYGRSVAYALLDRIDDDPDAERPPALGVMTRLRLLLGARLRT